MRQTALLICFFLIFSCEFDFKMSKKITVDEFLEEELKSLSWNEVDQYPVFENCLDFENINDKNDCFVLTITENFTKNLKKNDLVLNRTKVDTINLLLKIDKQGNINLERLENYVDRYEKRDNVNFKTPKENMAFADKIEKIIVTSFDTTIKYLPKIYPAIKRGQKVDITFNLPILISTEN